MADEKPLAEREPWRDSVLSGMLTVSAIVTPALACFALFISHRRVRGWTTS